MRRFARSLILGLFIGGAFGLYFGWLRFPADYRSSGMGQLEQRYKDDYVIMIAAGYALDGDALGAVKRLSQLGISDAAAYVQQTAERVITTSSRSLSDIRLLIGLADGLGRRTPLMAPFFNLSGGKP